MNSSTVAVRKSSLWLRATQCARLPQRARFFQRVPVWAACLALALGSWLGTATSVSAAPSAKLLRVDPRAGLSDGTPVLTTLLEVGEPKNVQDALAGCNDIRAQSALFDCFGDAVEKDNALWRPFQFPKDNANLFVRVDGTESPARYVSHKLFRDAQKEPGSGVGTAWLIAVDASSGMGARYGDAREVVLSFLGQMGPNDLIRVILFDDRDSAYTGDSKWKSFKERAAIVEPFLNSHKENAPGASGTQGRALFNQVKGILGSGFSDLGNTDNNLTIPIHQAFVLLSNGAGRSDALSSAAGGEQIRKFATLGRFPEDNTSSPKTPLPIISILFPNPVAGLANQFYANNDVQFMQSLANPDIGGFYSVVRSGQGTARGDRIAKAVKARFNTMTVVRWKLACLSPTVEQSFNLTFTNTKQAILPDGSFKNVPIGVDPTQWPLDINVDATKADAENNPVTPGGLVTVYGDFCWGGDKGRAEAFFVPAGTRPDPNQPKTADAAKRAMQNLAQQGMRGEAVELNATFVKFRVPDDDKVLEGEGESAVARLVAFDNRANRGSAVDDKVLTLRARKKPFPIVIVASIAGGALLLLAVLALLLRGGGKKRGGGGGGSGGGRAPQPMVAGPPGGYGPPGGGGGGPGGGYGAPGGGYGPPGGGGYGQYRVDGGAMAGAASAHFGPASDAPQPAYFNYAELPAVAAYSNSSQPGTAGLACARCGAANSASGVCFSCGYSLNSAEPAGVASGVAFGARNGGDAHGASGFRRGLSTYGS